MKKQYYLDAVDTMTYPNGGKPIIKKADTKNFKALIEVACDNNDQDKLLKAMQTIGFNDFKIQETQKAMSALNAPKEEKVTLTDLCRQESLFVALDEAAERAFYIVKELDKTGFNKAHRIFRKSSLSDLVSFVASRSGIKPEVIDSENIPALTPMFDPNEEVMYEQDGVDYFNTWTEPALLCLDEEDNFEKPELVHLIELIFENLFGSKEAQEYVMNVLAYSYQNKSTLPIILVLVGVQGSAKGLIELLLKAIYTEEHMSTGDKKNNIFVSSDNGQLKDTLVYLLDEAPIGPYYEMAKRYAGNSTFELKQLYQNTRTYPNRALFINTFNLDREDEVKFTIPEDDRRLSVFHSKRKINTYPEFQGYEYHELGDIFKKGSLPEYFAQVLANWEVDKALIANPFDNEIRQRWIAAGKDHTSDFYNALLKRDLSYFAEVADDISVDGYSVLDSISRMFNNKSEIRVTSISGFFKAIFGESENKEKRDEIMKGLRTKDGVGGVFIYDIPQARAVDPNDPLNQLAGARSAESYLPTAPPAPRGYA